MEYEAILECLEQKRTLFAQYEECTANMRDGESDVLQNYITERAGLATKIDRLDVELSELCEVARNPELIRSAISNEASYGDLPPDLRQIYDKGAQIITLVDRVYRMETQIVDRMQQERSDLMEKIKKGSGTAKVYNYVKSMQSTGGNVYLGNKKA